jgi:hypothetical protein
LSEHSPFNNLINFKSALEELSKPAIKTSLGNGERARDENFERRQTSPKTYFKTKTEFSPPPWAWTINFFTGVIAAAS